MYLMSESLSEQRQRVGYKVKLVGCNALAAVSCNGQGVPLSVNTEKLQIQQTVGQPALQRDSQPRTERYGSNRLITGCTFCSVLRKILIHFVLGKPRQARVCCVLTACRMALLCLRESISSAVRACSATSINWITWSYTDTQTNKHKRHCHLVLCLAWWPAVSHFHLALRRLHGHKTHLHKVPVRKFLKTDQMEIWTEKHNYGSPEMCNLFIHCYSVSSTLWFLNTLVMKC